MMITKPCCAVFHSSLWNIVCWYSPGASRTCPIHIIRRMLITITLFLALTPISYIGSYLSHSELSTGDIEINHRIQMAYNKFASMSNLLQNRHIFLKTRVKFLNSFVRSRLTYSCQNWNLTLRQYEKLDVTYRNLLRRMVRGGFKRCGNDDSDFRYKLSNDKIHNICGTSNVSNFIKNQQKSYASHVVRMPKERSTKQLMFNDDKYHRVGRAIPSLLEQVLKNDESSMDMFINNSMKY